jgi:O-glycosyl hydrolase
MSQFPILSRVIFLSLFLFGKVAGAQDYIQPVADYSFGNSQLVDNSGNTALSLYNNAGLFDDPARGKVLRFSATQKSFAVLDKQLLQSDSCTVSFFFYWENEGAASWHQIFEIHNAKTGSNLYFTPQNGWGSNQCSLISDCKEYGTYENVDARPLSKNTWVHIAVTFNEKLVTIYLNGHPASKGYTMFTPDLIHGDSLYFGGNPYRSDNYYITARLDDVKIFDKALSSNQIQALYAGIEIPEPTGSNTVWETTGTPLQVTIDLNAKKQTIRNFGASDAWNTEQIGKYWPAEKKNELAERLFSTEKDGNGNPVGIGLSAWRFNIGAGTAEQGNASRISNASRRTEGFLNPDSVSYDWNKQQGQQWFLKEAATTYHVPCIIGWVNSPPVLYTQKNLGFRDFGTPMATILKEENFSHYARFLSDVVAHFEGEGVHFNYISPLNEPQWGWAPSASGGTVDQEGSPWTNQEIYDVTRAITNEFSGRGFNTEVFLSEAGSIANVLGGTGHADNQLTTFWNVNSPLSLAGTQTFANIGSFHSYWSDYGNLLVDERTSLSGNAGALNPAPELWQTEYSLLGSGYREGYPASQKLSEMDCALSLARIITADLNVANTSAWQWWTTFEKGKHAGESRFSLIEAFTDTGNENGEYHLNKLFFTLGNFSHFIRPGMTRIETTRSDALTLNETYHDVVFSAYVNDSVNQLVLVAVNFTSEARAVTLSHTNASGKTIKNLSLFLTNEFSNLTKQPFDVTPDNLVVPSQSVVTITAGFENGPSGYSDIEKTDFDAILNPPGDEIVVRFSTGSLFQQVMLYGISGNLIGIREVESGQKEVVFPASDLTAGVYLVSGRGDRAAQTRKIIIAKR